MTPKAPSGTPRSWKSKFQAWLTRLTGAGLPPVSAPSPTPLAPQHPFLAQEPVSEANRPGAVAEARRIRQLMDHICAENNANVTRDYGTHIVDVSSTYESPPLMTPDDMADAKKLLDVLVVGKPGAEPPTKLRLIRPTPAQVAAQQRRERSRCVQHPALFVPDLPSAAAVQAQIASVTGYEPPAPAPSCDSGGGGDFGGGGASSSWD